MLLDQVDAITQNLGLGGEPARLDRPLLFFWIALLDRAPDCTSGRARNQKKERGEQGHPQLDRLHMIPRTRVREEPEERTWGSRRLLQAGVRGGREFKGKG